MAFAKWLTVSDDIEDLDGALTWVLQRLEELKLETPTINIQPIGVQHADGMEFRYYTCTVTGKVQ